MIPLTVWFFQGGRSQKRHKASRLCWQSLKIVQNRGPILIHHSLRVSTHSTPLKILIHSLTLVSALRLLPLHQWTIPNWHKTGIITARNPRIRSLKRIVFPPKILRRSYGWLPVGSDIIKLDIAGAPVVVLNSVQAAVELLEKRSSSYSSRFLVRFMLKFRLN